MYAIHWIKPNIKTRDTSPKSTKLTEECEQLNKNEKFFCDRCDYDCMNKNKHKIKNHRADNLSTHVAIENETSECEDDIDWRCTVDSVCDECLDYWVRKASKAKTNNYFKEWGQLQTDCIAPSLSALWVFVSRGIIQNRKKMFVIVYICKGRF